MNRENYDNLPVIEPTEYECCADGACYQHRQYAELSSDWFQHFYYPGHLAEA